jgi:Zn-dependent protease with chaperone function
VNPFVEEGLAGLFVTHPPVAERVRRLRELDPEWRERLRAA